MRPMKVPNDLYTVATLFTLSGSAAALRRVNDRRLNRIDIDPSEEVHYAT